MALMSSWTNEVKAFGTTSETGSPIRGRNPGVWMGPLRRTRGRTSHTTQPPTPQARGDTICRFEVRTSSSIRSVASPVNVIMQPTPDDKGTDFGLSQLGQVALRIRTGGAPNSRRRWRHRVLPRRSKHEVPVQHRDNGVLRLRRRTPDAEHARKG